MSQKHFGYLYQGNKVGLRALSKSDLSGNYLRWFNDPEVMRYSSNGIYHNTYEKFEKYIDSLEGDRSRLVWAMDELSSQKHIGNVSLQSIDFINRNAEIAIILGDKTCWGKGLAKEALQFVFKHGFERMNLHRIYCGTAASNHPMQFLAEKLRMKKEGIKREALFLEGKYIDVIYYGILKQEFFLD